MVERALLGRCLGGVGERPLAFVPAIVGASRMTCRFQIDLFPLRLPDIGNPQVAGLPIKAPAPGIAQPQRPDFAAGGLFEEGVVARYGIFGRAVRIGRAQIVVAGRWGLAMMP